MTKLACSPAAVLLRAGLTSVLLAGCAVSPSELDTDRLSAIAEDRATRLRDEQTPLPATVTLHTAITRALRHNLDHQVELAEQAVRERELDLAHYSLLPNIVANSGYTERDKVLASNSRNVVTGTESLATSTSSDKRLRTADIAFGWNILDFGLSYVRARQAADKVLIQQELRRKIRLRIIENVRTAYWRAATAQRLMARLGAIEAQAADVETSARRLSTDRDTPQLTALTYEREIIEIQRTLGELQRELNVAHAQLAALMNAPPNAKFRVVPSSKSMAIAGTKGALPELVRTALVNRPELREVEYQRRINEQEAHAALLELLPGVNLLAGANYDSNSFLLHNDWLGWSAKASWNLMKVFSYPARRDLIEQQGDLLDKRSLAVAMAVVTQVYVSRVREAHAAKEYRVATRYRDVQHRLTTQIRDEATAGRVTKQTQVREELNALVAEVKKDLAHAALESATANVAASLGLDPYPDVGETMPSAGALAASQWSAVTRRALGGPAPEATHPPK